MTKWPLFHCISVDQQAKLMQLQWDTYGFNIDIPAESQIQTYANLESTEEIGRIIRQKPRHAGRK